MTENRGKRTEYRRQRTDGRKQIKNSGVGELRS